MRYEIESNENGYFMYSREVAETPDHYTGRYFRWNHKDMGWYTHTPTFFRAADDLFRAYAAFLVLKELQ